MTGDNPLFLDTNLLIEATNAKRRQHEQVRALIETHPRLVFSAQVLREYLVVATRPTEANGLGLSLPDALENVHAFRENIRLLPEERPILPTLIKLVGEIPCAGKRIHDAHIVATLMVHKVGRIATLNAEDFRAFSKWIVVLTPTAAASAG